MAKAHRLGGTALALLAVLGGLWFARDWLPQPMVDALRSAKSAAVDLVFGASRRQQHDEALRASIEANWDGNIADLSAPCAWWDGQAYRSEVAPIGPRAPVAPPYLVFSDFRCGPCRAEQGRLEAFMRHRSGARVCFIEVPLLGEDSRQRAIFALTRALAGEEYVHVRREVFGAPSMTSDQIENAAARDMVARNMELARRAGIFGTPTYYIDGEAAFGALPGS